MSPLPDLLERNMLELWMLDPTAIYAFWEHVLPEHLRSPVTRLIYDQCSELVEQEGKPASFDNLMTAFDKRLAERQRQDDLNKLRDPELSDEEKLRQLLDLQQQLRE